MVEIAKEYFDGYVDHVFENVEVRWAKVFTPDTEFGKNEWCIDVLLQEPQASDLKAKGFNVREKDGENVLRCKKKVISASGKPNKPPVIVDRDANKFEEEIGNGSICNIKVSCKAWAIGGSPTLTAYLDAIQVVKHVPRGTTTFAPIPEDSPF